MNEMTRALNTLILIIVLGVTCIHGQVVSNDKSKNYASNNLVIQEIANGVYVHTSFLKTDDFGNVPCNGMIVLAAGEAIIFDTPAENAVSQELIDWVEAQLECKVKAVIPTHFHADCLGGLDEFHKRGILSYANNLTIMLAELGGATIPQIGFDDMLELNVGNKAVIVDFLGEGHTRDNVIGYFPDEQIMFGGCLVKELGAGVGYLGDATVNHWSLTGIKLKAKYPDTRLVIPGHGELGDASLLDYTIELFQQYQNN